jgi:CxxC motif-containing protein
MRDEIICTICPLGCELDVEYEADKIITVTGNRCRRGLPYAEKETLNPERVLTTTVRLSGGAISLLPVKTNKSIPRDQIAAVMKEALKIRVRAPIRAGKRIIKNICRTDADLIATRTIKKGRPAL